MDKKPNLNAGVRKKVVEEVPYGLYIWATADGKVLKDEEGNFLNIPAIKGDRVKIQRLRDAARSYGFGEGKPVWLSGHRRVTDEEYEMQKQRLTWGLVPDELDVPAIKEDLIDKKNKGIL